MKRKNIRFKVFSLRNIENPFTRKGLRSYECIVDVKELPDLEEWRDINVRDAKLTGSVPRKITNSFHDNPELFLFMNRGVLLSVDSLFFDQEKKELEIVLSDKTIHGIGDGGHTYTIISNEAKNLADDVTQYVKLEILQGFSHDDIVLVVEGRNTSNQVKDQSLMELSNKFDGLKEQLPLEIIEKISFTEYDLDKNSDPKPVDIREVVALLTIFNKDLYQDESQPVIAYSSKQACLQRYREKPESYETIYKIAKDILVLHDYLYCQFSKLYDKAAKNSGKSRGNFGNLTGVTKQPMDLFFTNKQAEYNVPSGFLYPLLNAFRAFLEKENGIYYWGKNINPLEMVDSELTIRLVGIIGEEALKNSNPNKTGKSALLWQTCYQNAELFYLKMK